MASRIAVRLGSGSRSRVVADLPRTRLYDAISSQLDPVTIAAGSRLAGRLAGIGAAALLFGGAALATPADLQLQPSSIDTKGAPLPSCASTFVVSSTLDGGAGSLRDAITAANQCPGLNTIDASGISGTIALTAGQLAIFDGYNDLIYSNGDGDIVIVGPGSDQLTIDAQDNSRIFDITAADAAISGLTLTNGTVVGQGGAMHLVGYSSYRTNNFDFDDLTITGNSSPGGSGGGIAVHHGDMTLLNSTVTSNSSDFGGGIDFHAAYYSNMTVVDSTIAYNTATASQAGGGIAFHAATFYRNTLTIEGGRIAGNTTAGSGGGVVFSAYYDSSLSVYGTEFANNHADEDGGGLLVYASQGTTQSITNASFTGNVAGYDGGGIAVQGYQAYSSVLLDTVVMDGNTAVSGNGGGLSVEGYLSDLDVQGSTVANNAAQFGGGIALVTGYRYPIQAAVISDTTISGNTTTTFGGGGLAVVSASEYLTLDGVTLQDNIATTSGGGLMLYGSASPYATPDLTIVDSLVTGNTAMDGHGGGLDIRTAYYGSVDIANSTIDGNDASAVGSGGGGISLYSYPAGDARIAASTISGNTAGYGGGVRSILNGVLSIENTTISGNDATDAPGGSGGGIRAGYGELVVQLSTIAGNSATASGGGIDAAFPTMLRNSIVAGNTAAAGPDIQGSVAADFTLVQDTSGATLSGGNNITGQDPLLGPLADNGGPTLTHLPAADSPTRNAGDPAFAPPPATDQRGIGFPREVGPAVDMGAVEGGPVVDSLLIAPDPFAEGTGATLTVGLDSAAGADVFATIAFSGPATLDIDFSATDDDPGSTGIQVLIPSGSTSGDIALTASADGVDEPDEALTADLAAVAGPALEAGTLQDSATIADADPTPTISIADASAAEAAGTLAFTVSLSNPSSQPITVDFASINNDALAPQDYTAVSGTLTFTAGQTSQPIPVSLSADALDEPDETFLLELANPSATAVIGDGQATGTITDSTGAPGVSLSLTQGSVAEDGGSTDVVATLSAVSAQDVLVTLSLSGSAVAGSDYSIGDDDGAAGIQILIPAGSISGSVTITMLGDTEDEGDETILVDIASAINAQETGVQQDSVTIEDSPGGGVVDPGTTAPPPVPQPAMIPTLSEWMLLLLGLLLPASVVARMHRKQKPRT